MKTKMTKDPQKILRGVIILMGMLLTGVGAIITSIAPASVLATLITFGIVDCTNYPVEILVGTGLFILFSLMCYHLYKVAMRQRTQRFVGSQHRTNLLLNIAVSHSESL